MDEADIESWVKLKTNTNLFMLFQKQETQNMVTTILEVQPRMSSGEGGKTSDEIVDELASSILEKMEIFKLDIDNAEPSMFKLDSKGR